MNSAVENVASISPSAPTIGSEGNWNLKKVCFFEGINLPIKGEAVAVRVKTPAIEKYIESNKLTMSLSKYLNAKNKLPNAIEPTIGNFIASSLVIVSRSFTKVPSSFFSRRDRDL